MLQVSLKKDKATFIGSLMYTLTCFPQLAVDFICSVGALPKGKRFAEEMICFLFLPNNGPPFAELVADVQKLCSAYNYVLFPSFIPVHDGKAVTFKIVF